MSLFQKMGPAPVPPAVPGRFMSENCSSHSNENHSMQLAVTTHTRNGPSTITFKLVIDVDLYVAKLKGRPIAIVEDGHEYPSYEEWRQRHPEPRLAPLI